LERIKEQNIDEAITISRIAWDNFSILKESADTKKNSGVSRHENRISIQRKTGKQKYTGYHFDEAIKHANARGISYSIIVYDTVESLPEKTLIVRENGVLAVVDIQSGTWQMARDMFEVTEGT
jgi:hypothetical protein